MSATWRILVGDALEQLRGLPAASVHTCITSPPYFGLRDYGTAEWEGGDPACEHLERELRRGVNLAASATSTRGGAKKAAEVGWLPYRDVCGACGARRADRQLGLEASPDEFVAAIVEIFREVRRVLRDDGTLWLNLGDSYNSNFGKHRGDGRWFDGAAPRDLGPARRELAGIKPKDLLGMPWLVAFALRADGWYLRSDIIWAKPNPMPESVTDRPTKAHEYLFLLAKRARYYYDADAIREPAQDWRAGQLTLDGYSERSGRNDGSPHFAGVGFGSPDQGRNKRSVWTIATQPFPGAHFATFPPKLIEPCVLAGAPEGGVVLDPFAGAGTTGLVALRHGRSFVGIELNPAYAEMARERIRDDAPLLNLVAEIAA